MKCMWKELLGVLPPQLREDVDKQGRENTCELRLRLGQSPELVRTDGSVFLPGTTCQEDLSFVVNTASRYSPWAAETMAEGYLTAPGGHRIGLCGTAAMHRGEYQTIRDISAACIRIARDFPGISKGISDLHGSILLIGPPGSGKTTLLRDLIRRKSEQGSVAVVDERGELFPTGFDRGKRTDVMTGCTKSAGIGILLRTMGPTCIAMDEITSEADCEALIRAAWCGVELMASVHASSLADLEQRPIYRRLIESRLFQQRIVLRRDKSYEAERM